MIDDPIESTEVIFESVNIQEKNPDNFDKETVFKMRAYSKGYEAEDNFIRVASKRDQMNIEGVKKLRIKNFFEES